MRTLLVLMAAMLLPAAVFPGCSANRARDDSFPLAELVDSQSQPYAVPPTEDVEFTVHAALAAVLWAKLDEEHLLEWGRCWRAVRAAADRPFLPYEERLPDGRTRPANLFERSPRDGFCVAHAFASSDRPLQNERLRTAMEGIRAALQAR